MTSSSVEQHRRAGERAAGLGPASVAICAYTMRRWDDLTEAVGSVLAQLRTGDECLLVIDYNDELLARASAEFARYDAVRVVANAQTKGLSGARNTAIAGSRGGVVAFLDDDAVAAPAWLASLLQIHESELPLGVGGHVRPHWHDGQPAWFPAEFGWVVGCGYRGLPVHQAAVRNIIGANMSFRKDVLDELGGFDGRLGRVGSVPLGCDETELCVRAHRRWPNGKIIYDRHNGKLVEPVLYTNNNGVAVGLGASVWKPGDATITPVKAGVLSTELAYTLRTLPAGVARGFRAARSGDLFGLLRAAAIILGLGVTTAGFAVGRLGRSTSPRHA